MNPHQRGLQTERLFRKKMENEGWLVEQKNWSRFQKKDFWDCFDILAIKDGECMAVQIKTNKFRKAEVRKRFNKIKKHIPKDWYCIIQMYHPKKKAWSMMDMRLL